MSYLILSTYPGKGSRNSGDDLIAKSLIKLIKGVKGRHTTVDILSLVDLELSSLPNLKKYKAILFPALRPTLQGYQAAPPKRNDVLKQAINLGVPVYAIGQDGMLIQAL
ncbi:hypothetical protein MUN89_20095 [Halobacillus salinarum]|uniref:Uncharacterized protein n=1 Tax=Halobacillus salinarum TaxID=2932257 RepID=A0ABY4EKQ9_9BACI|nr:hypothetical protein [Halobacillus salinarum]UOQ44132.1 hypothetical protein MUN89_20095 [Halobacillus salinarum]